MKGRRFLALSVVAIAFGCQDQKGPTAPAIAKAPPDPSAIISDGAHGGNPDFFFLPPMVPLPVGNPNFELGKFNNSLKPSLRIEICELKAQNLNAQGLPTAATDCIAGAPKKTFAPGSVNLVNLPRRENGWWSLFGLPPDGFYYVLWDTRQSNLSVNKFYRIKVLIDGSSAPLGVADVDPMSSLREWKFTRTGDVVQLVDDIMLPIPFRIERSVLCPGVSLCNSATITNHTPNGEPQVVRITGADGSAIAGVAIPDGFLPATGPQSVVLTITRVNTGVNNLANGTQANPCHANLHLQQFNSCFKFETIPALSPIEGSEDGRQFLKAITVAVCFVLHDTEDPRAPYVQLFSSDPGEAAKPLKSAPDGLILAGPSGHDCGDNLLGFNSNSNGFTRFASAGWRKVTGGLGKLFGVETAYAIDLGLGGLAFDLSNIGPAMNAHMSSGEFNPEFSVAPGEVRTLSARIVGTQKHDGSALSTGIPYLPIEFAIGEGSVGGLRRVDSDDDLSSKVTDDTDSQPIFPGSGGSGGGFAVADWEAPMTPGVYTVTATSPSAIGAVTYNITVRPPDIGLNRLNGIWVNENPETADITRVIIGVEGNSASVHAFGRCVPTDCDWGTVSANTSAWTSAQTVTATWNFGFKVATQTITWLTANRIRVSTFHDYTVEDGRTDQTITEFFNFLD